MVFQYHVNEQQQAKRSKKTFSFFLLFTENTCAFCVCLHCIFVCICTITLSPLHRDSKANQYENHQSRSILKFIVSGRIK